MHPLASQSQYHNSVQIKKKQQHFGTHKHQQKKNIQSADHIVTKCNNHI